MKDELKKLIKDESKKNPLTDSELAKILNCKREIVSKCRKELGIEDSRERRKPLLVNEIEKLLSRNNTLSERELTAKLNESGFDISRHSVRSIKKEYENQNDNMKIIKNNQMPTFRKRKAFENLIGHDGYLKPFIQQAKAAMLYPPNGVHTLILGPTGVGKNELAEAMYQFSKEENMVREESSLIVFNCADYADNPQLLMAQLFGYVKGAFTGAETEKEGLVEKANGSILFLDEVHRLPNEGQELLFNLIDNGKFRRLGETDREREVQVTIIAATTESPDSILLVTFRRRIPMVIELPLLNMRPLKERLDIIKAFLNKEAYRTKTIIQVSNEAIRALLLYDCPGNIGQLRSDIQVSCARSFLNHMVSQTKMMKIGMDELPSAAKKGLLRIKTNRIETEKLIGNNDLIVHPKVIQDKIFPNEDIYTFPNEIYHYIENRFLDLQNQDMSQEVINYIIGSEMEERLEKLMKRVEDNVKPLEKKDLIKIVGIEVINVVENIIKVAKGRLGITVENLYYVLAVHLSTTIDRLKQGKIVKHPQLDKIKREYKKEYKVAKEMVSTIENELDIKLTEDEAGFITMYLRMMTKEKEVEQEGKIGVVVLSHGNVASAMADVANRLLGVIHARFVEMSLDESPESAIERATKMVINIDEGKGVLFLVDMGSLLTFGDIISQKTGVKIRTISKVNMLTVIEVVRRSILPDADIDNIADSLAERPKEQFQDVQLKKDDCHKSKDKVIVTLCMTGEGTATTLIKILEKKLPKGTTYIAHGAVDIDINKKFESILKTYSIAAIVGSYNPYFRDTPFFSTRDILKDETIDQIKKLLMNSKDSLSQDHNDNKLLNLKSVIKAENTMINLEAKDREDVLNQLCDHICNQNLVKKAYKDTVFEREKIAPTFFNMNTAVPHGDSQYINTSTVVFAKLNKKMDWDQGQVEYVVLLAAKVEDIKLVQELYNFLTWECFEKSMKNINSFNELYKLIDLYP